MNIVLLILLFVVAWVVLILPKQRELKRHNALVAALAEGDEVMSGSGIYGTITAIDGDVIHLEVAPGIEIRVARRAVASKVSAAELEGEEDEFDDDEVAIAETDETDETDEIAEGDEVTTHELNEGAEAAEPVSDDRPGRG